MAYLSREGFEEIDDSQVNRGREYDRVEIYRKGDVIVLLATKSESYVGGMIPFRLTVHVFLEREGDKIIKGIGDLEREVEKAQTESS